VAVAGAGPDLLARTAELVAIPSPSHGEAALADHLAARLAAVGDLEVVRIGDNVVARTTGSAATRVLLAGHLDTVPANGNEHPRVEGDVLWGLGTADMKSGLAVMEALATTRTRPPVELTFVLYTAEEVAREHSGLLAIERQRPDLLAADVAVLGEPTGAQVEAGCQGVLRVEVTIGGHRAHTARPWMGTNAVHRLAPVLATITSWEPREPVLDGCRYREALQVVRVEGGQAANVVPDRARLLVNHRYAPDRSADEALVAMEALLAPHLDPALGDAVRVAESAPAAPPALGHPVLAALVAASRRAPRAKLGWTDVAFFAERGVPAANFGPGDPEVAHTAGERVERRDLDAVHAALRQALSHPLADGQPHPTEKYVER
jgi:succinyl-diaminopimelate desuccinylase